MQPLTRGPEADETKTMTAVLPHHACVPLSKRRQHHLARSTCAAAFNRALLATRRRHGVQVREQLCRRALYARADGLDNATDHLLCEGAVCTRVCDRVIRPLAVPRRTELRCGSELEL